MPGNGDSVWIKHAITANVNTTVGLSNTLAQAGTGTVTSSGTTVTGSGTSFTTQLKVGDQITFGSFTRTVRAITSNTVLTIGANTTQASGVAFTFSPASVYVDGAAGGSLTIGAGVTLVVRGDCNIGGSTFTMNAGAHYRFDSSVATGTPVYHLFLGAGELSPTYNTTVTVNPGATGASSRCVFDIAAGSGVGTIIEGAHSNYLFTYCDFTSIGSASVNAINVSPQAAQNMLIDNCTFTACGTITGGATAQAATSLLSITHNQWFNLPANPQIVLSLSPTAQSGAGTRVMTDNVFAVPDAGSYVSLGNLKGWTIQRNVFARCTGPASGGNMTSFDNNLFYLRTLGTDEATTAWSFMGNGGDTLSNCYFINDETSPGNQHELMASDTAGGTAGLTWTLTNYIYERVGPTPAHLYDVSHVGQPTVQTEFIYDHILVLPTADGTGSGTLSHAYNVNSTFKFTNNTLMGDPYTASGTNIGAIYSSAVNPGGTGIVTLIQDNLLWSKGAYPYAGSGNYLAAYASTQASPSANVPVSSGVTNNAFYNAANGTLYDATGANGTSILGYDRYRMTTKWTGATDVNLGSGSNEMTQGPRFVDSSRNLAKFDSAYLGNTATAWVTGHAYAVGDMVSASTSTFYGGATINYRCVLAHTSATGNATNGKPGDSATTAYRTNWEFASAYRIRQAIAAGTTINDSTLGLTGANYITTLWTWVRAGFAPTNTALHNADHLGTGTPGAVPLLSVTNVPGLVYHYHRRRGD